MTDSTYTTQVATRVDAELIETIWNSFVSLGLTEAKAFEVSEWFATSKLRRGVPTRYSAEVGDGLKLVVEPLSEISKTYRAASAIDVRVRCNPPQLDAAREYIAQFITAYESHRQDLCLGAGAFLGETRFAWHDLQIGQVNPGFHEVREEVFAGWELLDIGDPRQGQMTVERVTNWEEEDVAIVTNARYYYKQDQRRVILDLHRQGGVAVAGSNMTVDELDQLLEAIEQGVNQQYSSLNNAVTASGQPIRLENTVGWDDLFLLNSTKTMLRAEVENFFSNRAMFEKLGVPHRRGLLLHGPPGNGKTMFGKVLACTVEDCLFIWITASEVMRSDAISQVFAVARKRGRTILFFEDLDMYASRREAGYNTATLGELLVQMDGMHSNAGVMVIATTNDLSAIEPALKDRPSRFDQVIDFGPLAHTVRRQFLDRLLGEFCHDAGELDRIADATSGFSGAQLQELALVAKTAVAQRGGDRVTSEDVDLAIERAARYRSTPTGFGGKIARDEYM